MLIQITNKCNEGCAHCLQSSTPDGGHMSRQTLLNALAFGEYIGAPIYVISGGEPTEHPEFMEFCKIIDSHCKKNNAVWSVTSNGSWFPERKDEIEKLLDLPYCGGMQVFTNKKWYRNYGKVKSYQKDIASIPKVGFSEATIYMQDLGRARGCKSAQEEVARNPYHMSCCNCHLAFKQKEEPKLIGAILMSNSQTCKPLVDFNGGVHASESWLCQSFGNVNALCPHDIVQILRNEKPCYGCSLGRKFAQSTNPRISIARRLLNSNI